MRCEQSETHESGREGDTNGAIDQGDSFERAQKKSNKERGLSPLQAARNQEARRDDGAVLIHDAFMGGSF